MTKPDSEIRVERLPRILNTPSRLICYNGWSEETTEAFRKLEFEQLELRGTRGQSFSIPSLGRKTEKLERLSLKAPGEVSGLEQFSAVVNLGVSSCPRNGIDLSQFKEVRSFFFEWDDSVAEQLESLGPIESLGCMGFKFKSLVDLGSLVSLRDLAITQGGLASLDGIQELAELRSLELAHLRKLESIEAVEGSARLENLSLSKLPKLEGKLRLKKFRGLVRAYVVDTPLNIDFAGIGQAKQLEMIWVNCPISNLDWTELIGIGALRKIGIVDPELDEELLRTLVAESGRTLVSLKWAGPRRSKQIQLEID